MKFIKLRIAGWLIGVAITSLVISLIGCDRTNPPSTSPEQPQGFGMAAPDALRVESAPPGYPDEFVESLPQSVHSTKFYKDNGYSVSTMRGARIPWRGTTNYGVDTLDVTNMLIVRMEMEQKSPAFASDQNAQALFHLMQARQTLEGKVTTTEDGLPIIE